MRCLQALLLANFLILVVAYPSVAKGSSPADRAGSTSAQNPLRQAHPDTPPDPSLSPIAPAPTDSPLAAACDALLQTAVRRPYGWAWPDPDSPDINLPRGSVLVSFDPLASSTAGLLLYHAGQTLHNPAYIQAACQVARALAAAQQPNGRIPRLAVFGASPVPHDNPGPVPDRSPTAAALGLLLTLADDPTLKDEQIRRTATRAASWLAHQQLGTGAWVVAGGPPQAPGRPPGGPQRRPGGDQRSISLDSPDYRNSTFALLLSYEVLHDASLRRAAEKAIDRLLALRSDKPNKYRGLWYSTYDLRDQPTPLTLAGDPNHLDLLATRYALQTLLGAHLTLGTQSTSSALHTSAQTLESLEKLRQKDGIKYRYYSIDKENLTPALGSAVPAFSPAPQQLEISDLLPALADLNQLGRTKYQDRLSASYNFKQHLAIAICGLSDDPPTLLLPMDRVHMKDYILLKNKDLSDMPQQPSPDDLSTRIHRLWIQLLKFKAAPMAPRPD